MSIVTLRPDLPLVGLKAEVVCGVEGGRRLSRCNTSVEVVGGGEERACDGQNGGRVVRGAIRGLLLGAANQVQGGPNLKTGSLQGTAGWAI